MKAIEFDRSKINETGLTFRNYPCTKDCSGHQAGYDWATYWGITDPNECPYGHSNSFWEGCRSRGEGLPAPETDLAEGDDSKIHNREKLDGFLVRLCELVLNGQKSDPELHGMVGAGVLDPGNNFIARTTLNIDGEMSHAERNAIDAYQSAYGDIPKGSIIITTLSPCNATMIDRLGADCTEYIDNSTVNKVYCGYMDPSQDSIEPNFTLEATANEDIKRLCKRLAWTFLDTPGHKVK